MNISLISVDVEKRQFRQNRNSSEHNLLLHTFSHPMYTEVCVLKNELLSIIKSFKIFSFGDSACEMVL